MANTTTRTNRMTDEELWNLETKEGWSLARIVRELNLSEAVIRRYEKYRDKQRKAAARQRALEDKRKRRDAFYEEKWMARIAEDRDNMGGTWGR